MSRIEDGYRRAGRRWLTGTAIACGLLVATGAWAAPAPAPGPAPEVERIYGWELMSAAEREQLRERMHSAGSAAERAQIRAEHHQQMQARARERGLSLPDMPARQGRGGGDGSASGRTGPGRSGPGGAGAGGGPGG